MGLIFSTNLFGKLQVVSLRTCSSFKRAGSPTSPNMEHFELSACLVEAEAVHKTKNSPTSLTSLISNKGSFAIDEKFPLVHVDATWNEVSDALSSQIGFFFTSAHQP